jgi:diadenosine tetraphosphate (Ap4A) HIT family hydrolase
MGTNSTECLCLAAVAAVSKDFVQNLTKIPIINTESTLEITPDFILDETPHWVVNHHLASALPGYLMLGSKHHVNSLAQLPGPALAELGGLMANIQSVLETQLNPKWLYISRFGHDPRYPIHFHFIPVYDWVEELFWKDARYRLLETFGTQENIQTLTDGAELTLFIWREFGESPTLPPIQGPCISQVIERLREAFGLSRFQERRAEGVFSD